MTIRNALWLSVLVLAPGLRVHAAEPPDARGIEFFESRIRPILVEHCLACHGPDKQKAGLRLDAADSMRTGGDSGPVLEPGNPEDSLLVETIGYESVTRMPPRGKLAPEQVEALTEWVRIGAPMPEASSSAPEPARPAIDLESARSFWSFQPVAAPEPPAVSNSTWPRSPIDRFVLARLETEGLSPAPEADRHALIRRVSFDLTGLPPTPEEVDEFVSDPAPDAYERLIERLLSSPAYGERWARHWLDIARYGEDQAHSFQPRLYPNGYRYRDWVVSAFNSDMPYDRFLTEQIAADLVDEPDRLENLPALGFFACGPVYYGDKQKYDQIDDRIDTLCRGCARSDGRLRPLPRPQVRPHPHKRLLRPRRGVRQYRVRGSAHRSSRRGEGLRPGPEGDRRPGSGPSRRPGELRSPAGEPASARGFRVSAGVLDLEEPPGERSEGIDRSGGP